MAESLNLDSNKTLLTQLHNPHGRRLRSLVWNDFTKKQKSDGNYEAICNHCGKKFTANSRSGTTHLRNHLNFCLSSHKTDVRRRGGKKQPLSLKSSKINNFDKYGSHFDQESSRQDLSRMIILHDYSLDIVKDIGFQTFVRNLQPRFKLVSKEMILNDCFKIYENRRNKLSELLETLPCRVSLTLDRLGLKHVGEYLCLTCHFVDNDWKLQRKILNILHFEAPPTAEDICEGIIEKLNDWKISRKVSCMCLDQCGIDQVVADNLLVKFIRAMDSLHLNGDFFHFHGWVHALDVVVQDSMAQIVEICDRVRSCVAFVKSSHEKSKRFQNAALLVDAPKKSLVIDLAGNWRSTYLMIATVYEFKNVFKNLAEHDSDFAFLLLSDVEWDDVKSLKECLETFAHMITKFSRIREPTENHYFIDICGILLLLKSWSFSTAPIIAKLASQMFKTFEPYWDANVMVLAIASILDPRYKMKSIEYFFKNIYNGDYEAKIKVENIFSSFKNLYSEYVVHSANGKNEHALLCYTSGNNGCPGFQCEASGISQSSSHITLSDTRRGLDRYLQQTLSSQSIKSDLDLYLEESVYIYKDGPDNSFNVFAWWNINAAKYPILSLVARDILPIPLGNVTTRFEDRPLSRQYLSSLDPVSLQSMVCAQDWLRDEMEANLEEDECLTTDIVVKV